MSLQRLTISLCLVGAIVVGADVAAQENQAIPPMKQHPLMTPVDGAENPEKIPDFMKYHIFFADYLLGFRAQLVADIAPGDDRILSDAAAGLDGRVAQEITRYKNDIQKLCSEPVTDGHIEKLRQSQRFAEETNKRVGEYFRSVIQSLSSQGKEAVESFVSTHNTANITTSEFDYESWYANDPDGAKEEYEVGCYFAINGHYPSDVQSVIDENAEIAKQQAQRMLEEQRVSRGNHEK